MVRRKLAFILVMVIAALAAGCPYLWKGDVVQKDPDPEKLFHDAQKQFQDKRYSAALELYERLKSGYPDFKKMPEVYMKIGDAYFDDKYYDKAIAAYGQFMDLYPNNKDAPRAKFQIGMAYFNQIQGTDLDNSVVQRAATQFKTLSDDSSAGDWAKKAAEKYVECRKKLAAKEMYKAHTMMTIGKYQAARLAAKRVLDEYPKLGYDKDASALIKSTKGK
ncbi:MAG: outer membrane protein assembly factor BamD [Desulfomonilaceae bacterium]